jgi:hypothetical protein
MANRKPGTGVGETSAEAARSRGQFACEKKTNGGREADGDGAHDASLQGRMTHQVNPFTIASKGWPPFSGPRCSQANVNASTESIQSIGQNRKFNQDRG